MGQSMSKKETINKYFDKIMPLSLPNTTNKPVEKEKDKEYTTHKIFDDPSSSETHASNMSKSSNELQNIINNINTDEIILWEHKDRPANELGNLEEFAKVLKSVGQLQAGIVRPSKHPAHKYELIVGERRWRACKIAGLNFQAKILNLSDEDASIAQAVENEGRENLSDYARGISYAKKIEAGILMQKDLINKLGKSKQEVSRLLSFREIPSELIEAIGDMTKVSSRTSECIKQICKKNSENLEILMAIADKISSGIGFKTIEKHIEEAKATHNTFSIAEKAFSKNDQRHLFTLRKDGNGNSSISFPKDIRSIIDIKALQNILVEEIDRQINSIRLSS